ncbi:hypothetical protein [Paenibacillus urinalis]|uniref:Uncharacterized protein n=1 Tax=Paenibacillus urinalis TaxID=521520 RepID=A0AAX3N352_9BACL|nr:hypothetical protein [Paenibacillus urinalis]WDH83115.1 hypothetical protein PUW23_02395 [Paenibacillus urinalis]
MAKHSKLHKSQTQIRTWEGTDYDRTKFETYLSLYPVSTIRLNAGILVLFFLNVFLIIPILSAPYEPLYAYLLFPPLAVMNGWALALIAAPRKLQLNYILFRGVFGIVASLGLMLATQKFAYSSLELTTPWYAIGSFAVYGFALYHYVRSHLRKLRIPEKKQQEEHKRMRLLPLTMIAGLGYLLANLSLMFVSENTVVIVLMCVYSMLAFVLFHFIMELHRYYWNRRIHQGSSAPNGDQQPAQHG